VILDYNYGTYKGFYVENFVAQEFKAANQKTLYSWQVNRAEVEFLISKENAIIPVEVKSGKIRRSESLLKYVEKYKPPYRVILNANPQHIDLAHGVKQYPIYLAYWFVKRMGRAD
jgi:predicted AAA+ superfamily ATPase